MTDMTKKKVLVIIPDRFVKPVGGMGENSAPVFEILSKDYEFYVAGFPLMGTEVPKFVTEYRQVGSAFTEVKHGPLNTMASQIQYFAAAIKFPKPDVIYAYDWSIYLAASRTADYFQVPLITRMCLSPIMLQENGYTFGLNLSNQLDKALHNAFCEMEVRGLKRADRIIHVSKGYKNRFKSFTTLEEKSRIVINGINLEKWQDTTLEPYSLPGTGRRKIIFLGRLSEMKGILPLCQARIPADADIIFVGVKEQADARCWQAIEQKMQREKNVYFMGPLYGMDKIRALRTADALIVPSYHEPFGGVGLEGLAAECVVISSRADGLGDYLTDETSLYCGTDSQMMEQAFTKFMALTHDQVKQFHENGNAMCKKLNLESTAIQLGSVFSELMK